MNTIDTILAGDCLTILPTLAAGSVQLAYLDPPFNIGLGYRDYNDNRPADEYFAWLETVFRAVLRTLTPAASLWVQCGQTIQAEACVMLKRIGLHWRNSIIWQYNFGPHQTRKFAPSHQMIHGFSVHPKRFVFNDDAVREPSLRLTKYKDRRANPKGRVPGDVWMIRRECGTFKGRIKGHPCQTPLAVPEKIIRACSNPEDVVLDPMCGTGTACVAARLLGRRFIGIERSEATAEAARRRIAEMLPFAG
ncbi:MAG: DNA-methyltransferase [Gemmataceae bacterium]